MREEKKSVKKALTGWPAFICYAFIIIVGSLIAHAKMTTSYLDETLPGKRGKAIQLVCGFLKRSAHEIVTDKTDGRTEVQTNEKGQRLVTQVFSDDGSSYIEASVDMWTRLTHDVYHDPNYQTKSPEEVSAIENNICVKYFLK